MSNGSSSRTEPEMPGEIPTGSLGESPAAAPVQPEPKSFYVSDGTKTPRKPVSNPKAPTEPQSKPAPVPWGPVAAVLYAFAIFVGAQLVASTLLIAYPHLRGWDTATANAWLDNTVVAQFFFVLCAEVLTFGAIWWFVRQRGARLRVIGWRWPRWTDPLYSLAGFMAYFLAFALVTALATQLFPSINVAQKQDLGFDSVAGTTSLVLTFLSLVVLPPLVEETVFRGFLFTGLRTKLRPIWAALITSLLFASAHLQFGSGHPLLWVAGIDTFVLSLVLCYLRQKTDSLWPGILLHMLKNLIAFASLYIIAAH